MTKSLEAILAVKALVAAALPGVGLGGFDKDASKPQRIGSQGHVIGHPGDPGDPEVDLSPPAYNYSHRMFLEVIGANGAGGDAIDALLVPLGAAFAADRTLGGVVDYAQPGAPDRNDKTTDMVATSNWAVVPVDLEYVSSDPLA